MQFPCEHRKEVGTKKVSLNHLLNFTYEHPEESFNGPNKFQYHKKTVKNTFYNKEQFIQAK